LFVYIFGLFEGRGQVYKKRKAEEEQEKKEQPPAPANPGTITEDDPGLLRIKNENGSYVLDLDGRRVNPTNLASDQRRRLIDILNIMRPWLEGRSVPASAPEPSARPSPKPTTVDERLNAISSPENKPAPSQPVPPPARQTAKPPAPRSSTIAKEDRPAPPANSIVSQIDSILQDRLEGTPLEERGIFLTQSPEGGVIVYVGLTHYNGLDDVPDPEIKAAIRAAIAEWENKYTPGL
jgi:hypothetical protein